MTNALQRDRRAWLQRQGLRGMLVLSLGRTELAFGAAIVAVRVWPAKDYTRVTIESDTPLDATHVLAEAPPRLGVDINGLELNPALRELVGKIRPDDPFIAGVRVGQYQPKVVRLVFDLKQPVKPEQFTLAPVAAYRHRLVFDLFPVREADPMVALLRDKGSADKAAERAVKDALGELIAKVDAPVNTPALPPPAATTAGGQGTTATGTPTVTAGAPSPLPGATAPTTPAPTTSGAVPSAAPATAAPTTAAPATAPLPLPAPATGPLAGTSPPAATVPPPGAPGSAPAISPAEKRQVDRLIIVALDPGHGGEDPGAIGPTGLREKDVVLDIALRLRDSLNAQPGMRVMLTRDADYFVPLHERVRKARRVQADLLVSIHADAFMLPHARGASVFALSTRGATSAAARWMAQRENAADAVGGVNLARVQDPQLLRAMLDMSTTAQVKDSLKLGAEVLGNIGKVGRLHKRQVEQAGFAVLKAPDIPSILVETAFISNPEEEALLRDRKYREELVAAMAKGIKRYFARNPPMARQRQL